MLTTFITTTAILAVLYVVLHICIKTIHKPTYDFSTKSSKSMLIFGHTAFCVPFFVIALEIILYFYCDNKTALWVVFGTALLFAILGLLLLCELYFSYEAITGDVVYVHRFFTTKKINIIDIQDIKSDAKTVDFYGKGNKRLFNVYPSTDGIQELIYLINTRKLDSPNYDFNENEQVEKTAILTALGREYRASYKTRKKKCIIFFCVTIAVILSVIIAFSILADKYISISISLGVLFTLALLFCLFTFLYSMKKELNQDDFSLGSKNRFSHKKVKGASKHNFPKILMLCISGMLCGTALMLSLLGVSKEPTNYDEYTPITGTLEYHREQKYGKNPYIAIGLNDIPTEYRLYSLYLDEFDYSFFDEVEVGDSVTIYIDNSKDRNFTLSGVNKKQYNGFYYLSTNGKEYFAYEDYIKSHERNNADGWIMAYFGIAITSASVVALIISIFIYNKRRKEETIETYI